MTKSDDNVVSLEARRREKQKAEKQAQKTQRPKRQWNAGYVLLAVLVVGALLLNYSKMKPEAGTLKLHIVGDTAYGNGGTDRNSLRYVMEVFADNPQVSRLVLQNMPGTSDSMTNLRLAEFLRKEGVATHLESRSIIASGAVDLFIAGESRTMECGARIGVHSWRTAPGKSPETIGKDPFAQEHESFLRKMGIDPAFYAFTRAAAPPHKIHYMSMDEINQFELLSTPKDCS